MINFQTLKGFIIKELLQTFRDRRMMVLIFGVPLIQLMVFGFAISNEVKNIRLSYVMDHYDQKIVSLVGHLNASRWFKTKQIENGDTSVSREFESSDSEVVLIPNSRGTSWANANQKPQIQLLIDATDLLRAQSAEKFVQQIWSEQSKPMIETQVLYNPTMESAYQMVPGVICMIVCIFTIILTSMSITKEYESGTLEMLLVSPISKKEIIAGKSIPFFLIGFVDIFLILIFGKIVFNLPFRGPLVLYAISAATFLIATVGIGMLISTVAKSQQQSMMGGFMFLFPAMLLSGIMTPVSNMPELLQYLAQLNPLLHFVAISRNIMLKGGSYIFIFKHLTILVAISLAIFTAAIRRLHRTW